MRRLGRRCRILIAGSIAGFIPGTYLAVYNASKAFLDSFSFALRHELKGSGVSVTCLMPGATETDFFERADMMGTKIGLSLAGSTSSSRRSPLSLRLTCWPSSTGGWPSRGASAWCQDADSPEVCLTLQRAQVPASGAFVPHLHHQRHL